MTLTGAIAAVITRKVSAFVREIRALVATARSTEKAITAKAEADAEKVYADAKGEVTKLREELISKLAAL